MIEGRQRCVARLGPVLFALALIAWVASATAAAPAAASAPASGAAKKPSTPPVDVNSASRAQLKTLPGIGDAEATKIIAERPYRSKADLASRNVIPLGIYLSLKDRLIAIQHANPKGRTAASGASTKRP